MNANAMAGGWAMRHNLAAGYSSARLSPLDLVMGFAAGFVAVLVFHQLALALLLALGVPVPFMPYNFARTQPLGVPVVLSLAFWGGIWGIVFVLVERRFPRGARYWVAALVFGAVFPTLVGWFIVAPLKGLPVAGGWRPVVLMVAPIVNGAWGVGTALFLGLLRRWL
jgi:hypothetical protein